MVNVLRKFTSFLGFDSEHATVPVMDGALKPNTALDAAKVLLTMPDLANISYFRDSIIFSSGRKVYQWDQVHEPLELTKIAGQGVVTSLAVNSAGLLAVGRDDDGVFLHDLIQSKDRGLVGGPDSSQNAINCPTALLFKEDDCLVIASGSANHAARDWKKDLVAGCSTGSISEYSIAQRRHKRIAVQLAYPMGLATSQKGELLVSEAWNHRVLLLSNDGSGTSKAVINNLPGYPGGMCKGPDGTLHLALFAPRSQLFEFILTEKAYLARMVAETPQANWVCPTLRGGVGYREPLQGGAVRQMGVHKAWAPTLSYGLVIEFDTQFHPVRSWHSRADGHAHGTTMVQSTGDKLIVAATGDGKLLQLSGI